MPDTLYLHIGPHKTASTYLQKVCVDNRALLASQGLNYPREFIGPQFGHHQVPLALQEDSADGIGYLLAQTGDLLLSSENFSRLGAQEVERLRICQGERRLSVLFVKRRAADVLVSSWKESIKHDDTPDLGNYLLAELVRLGDPRAAPYQAEALTWFEQVPKVSLRVIDYDGAEARGEDLARLVLAQTSARTGALALDTAARNRSPGIFEAEVLRQLRLSYGLSHGFATGDESRRFYGLAGGLWRSQSASLAYLLRAASASPRRIPWAGTELLEAFDQQFYQRYGSALVNQRAVRNETGLLEYPNADWARSFAVQQRLRELVERLRLRMTDVHPN